MPASRGRPARARAHFDELAFSEDLSHASAAGRRVALDARRQLERDGIDIDRLKRCDAHGRDATRLERCVKVYLPTPAGAWRMVFEITRDPTSGDLLLAYLAYGLGHPDKPWQPSAYQVAHQRLHPSE